MNTASLSVKEDSFEYALLFTAAVVVATLQTIITNVAVMLKALKTETAQETTADTQPEDETVTTAHDYHTGYSEFGLRIVYEIDDSQELYEPAATGKPATLGQLFEAVAQYPDYEAMNIRQLKAAASKAHIKGYSDMRKRQLVSALHSHHRNA